jgi:hypothetical protein
MNEKPKNMTLATLGNGAAEELFQKELANVLGDIANPNKPWKTTRKISLTVEFVPNEERKFAHVVVTCEAKLPGAKPFMSAAYFAEDKDGKLIACEPNMQQLTIFDFMPENVSELKPAERKSK